MSLSPIKPRDNSKEEKLRYEADLKSKQENPGLWGDLKRGKKDRKSLDKKQKSFVEPMAEQKKAEEKTESEPEKRKAGRPKKSAMA